jgi:Zn-dependent protease with chaperone function
LATTAEDFRELERLYAENPTKYRRKVARWIALGYGSILLILALIVAFVGTGVLMFFTGTIPVMLADNFIKAGIPLLIVAGLTTRAVFMRLPGPSGIYLGGDLKHRILAQFRDIRLAAKGRKIDEVLLTNELNAAVVQTPRFGLFGPARNYLILGAPLLQLLTLEEVRAVVAHEFGHLSHSHGRMGSVVYRLDQTLTRAASAISDKNKGGLRNISFRFLDWFYRHFNTVTFAMRRGQEYEADQVASSATSPKAIASALCKLNAFGVPLSEFWNDVWRKSREILLSKEVFPQRELRQAVLGYATPELSATLIDNALARETDFNDSHPCLRDRLNALAETPVKSFSHETSALDELLTGPEREELLSLVDKDWQKLSAENWQRANTEYKLAIAEMQELRSKTDLERDELIRLAQLEEGLEGIQASLGTHQRLAVARPDDPSILFGLARARFEQDQKAAFAVFFRCLSLDVSFYPDVARYAQGELQDEVGAELEEFENAFLSAREIANRERESVAIEDDLIPVALGDDIKRALQEHASTFPEIRRLFLVEKSVQHFQHDRVLLLGIDVNTWHDNVEADESKWLRRACASFAERFPGLNNPYATLVTKKNKWGERLESIQGALIFEGAGKSKRTTWQKIKLLYWIVILIAIVVLVVGGFEI